MGGSSPPPGRVEQARPYIGGPLPCLARKIRGHQTRPTARASAPGLEVVAELERRDERPLHGGAPPSAARCDPAKFRPRAIRPASGVWACASESGRDKQQPGAKRVERRQDARSKRGGTPVRRRLSASGHVDDVCPDRVAQLSSDWVPGF